MLETVFIILSIVTKMYFKNPVGVQISLIIERDRIKYHLS